MTPKMLTNPFSAISVVLVMLLAQLSHGATEPTEKLLCWPTPNPAYFQKKAPSEYLQATASGRVASGDWGCSRNDGKKFHEGVDLKSVRKDKNGITNDPVAAIYNGVVAHVNRDVSESNYGKYLVINHSCKGLEWSSVYAHLKSIDRDIHEGAQVTTGRKIGIMGHTSSSIHIPESRAHLHFEIVLRMNSKFDVWYDQQHFNSPNAHGSWNGMNLQGINPFQFYDFFINSPKSSFYEFFLSEPVAFEALVHFDSRPDFVYRNPIFLRGDKTPTGPSWYNIGFTWYGLPVQWAPISQRNIDKRMDPESIYIRSFKHEKPCRNWVNDTPSGFKPTPLLLRHIELIKAGS